MRRATREWVKKAEADYRVAGRLAAARPRAPDHVCFLCQQAAEKYLKSLLEELGAHIPRTHDLVDLHKTLLPRFPDLKPLLRGMRFLKQFAVEYRYPGKDASGRQATAAVRWADR